MLHGHTHSAAVWEHPPAWQTEGVKRTPLYGELGGGISVPLGSSWTGSANVGFEFGGDRTSVGGNVGVNYAF